MLKIFISGTYLELKAYWIAVEDQLRRMRHLGVEMTHFRTSDKDPTTVSLQELDDCDVYLGIIGHRYGTMPAHESRSITRCEYDKAYELSQNPKRKMPILIYLADDERVPLPIKFRENDDLHAKQKEFRALLQQRHTISEFESPQQLASRVAVDLTQIIREGNIVENDDIKIFDIDNLKPVCEAIDSTIRERVELIDKFLAFIAERFESLFHLDTGNLIIHPFFKRVNERLEAIMPGISLNEEHGIIQRTKSRHVVLRTQTLLLLMKNLTDTQLLESGKEIGKSAAADLINNTVKQKKYIPASAEAFISLWDFWDRTGGWGKLSLIGKPDVVDATSQPKRSIQESEWRIKVLNNFLTTKNTEERHRLCRFWCGYIHGFLDEALPQIADLMIELSERQIRRRKVTLPSYHEVESVEHIIGDSDNEDIFRILFKKELFSDAFDLLTMSKEKLKMEDYRHSMLLCRYALNSAKAVLKDEFDSLLLHITKDNDNTATIEQMLKPGDLPPSTIKETADKWFEVANLLIKKLLRVKENTKDANSNDSQP